MGCKGYDPGVAGPIRAYRIQLARQARHSHWRRPNRAPNTDSQRCVIQLVGVRLRQCEWRRRRGPRLCQPRRVSRPGAAFAAAAAASEQLRGGAIQCTACSDAHIAAATCSVACCRLSGLVARRWIAVAFCQRQSACAGACLNQLHSCKSGSIPAQNSSDVRIRSMRRDIHSICVAEHQLACQTALSIGTLVCSG